MPVMRFRIEGLKDQCKTGVEMTYLLQLYNNLYFKAASEIFKDRKRRILPYFCTPFLIRMIQRIQSLYLLLAACCSGILLGAPLYHTVSDGASYSVYLGGLVQETPTEQVLVSQPAMVAVGALLALFPIIILFLYKRRSLQMRLSASAMLAYTAMLMLLVGSVNKSLESVKGDHLANSYGWGLILPLIGVIFLFLANRAIRKDENLVRSADRLR
jgi:hypothetical protein